jgi:CRISPR-associated protein Cas1
MQKQLYIFSDSIIKRKDNTILCETLTDEKLNVENLENDLPEDEDSKLCREEYYLDQNVIMPTGDKKYIPVENIESIYSFGSIRFHTRFLYFLSQHRIPIHIFNYNGSHAGSFAPANRNINGSILLMQADHYNNYSKRLFIAKQIITGAASITLTNLNYYNNRGTDLSDEIEYINRILSEFDNIESIGTLMGYEGLIKKTYYETWEKIFKQPVNFTQRVKHPPNNLINSLISYGNAIIYSICLDQIYQTRLYPEIGFIHEPNEGKLSLAYDLSEIFKLLVTDRVIFKVINKLMITEDDYVSRNGSGWIKKDARKIFVREFEEKLLTVINIRESDRNMSYRRLIKEECYKLLKHIKGEEEYKPFISRW